MKTVYRYVCIVLVPLLLAGCGSVKECSFTGRLWSDTYLKNYHTPADNPGAKAFLKADQKDVLVTYDEQQERNDKIKQKAFYVLENKLLLESKKKPRFVSAKTAVGLTEVPILSETNCFETNAISTAIILSSNQFNFQLVLTNQHQGEFVLPVYLEEHSRASQLFLTPLAVTGDAAAVATIFGIFALWAWAAAASNDDCNPY